MFGKHLNRRLSSVVILILSAALLVVSILYLSQRVTYSTEVESITEELDQTNKHFYLIQVESPLRLLLNYLTIRPAEEVDWDEQLIQETASILFELDRGIASVISIPGIRGIPEATRTELQNLQRNIGAIGNSLHSEQPLDAGTKERLMNVTQSIDACVQFADRQTWKRFQSDMECLNKEIISE